MAFTPIETQEDFDKAIQKRLKQKDDEMAARYKDFLAPDAVSELKKDYEKKLADARKDMETMTTKLASHDIEVADLTARAVKAETALLKNKVANDNGLPINLADRLVGENEEELTADAKILASYLRPSTTPPLRTNEPNGAGAGPGGRGTDEAYMNLLSSLTQ